MKRMILCLGVVSMVLAGCGRKKTITADEYYRIATEKFRNGSLSLAIELFRDLNDQFPFSKYSEEAELKVAHAQYLFGRYAEAIAAFTDFQRRHPTSPHLPFVGYHLGMCYVQQMGTTDRDQTAAASAQTYFQTVTQQYPDSPYAELARTEIARCRQNLAEHELHVARFYSKRGNRKAAQIRLVDLASRYGDTDASAEALLRLGNLYRREQDTEHAALAYQALTQLHPRAPQAAAARRALQRMGDAMEAGGDPIELLMAANGRQRESAVLEPVQVPGLDPVTTGQRFPAAGAGVSPPYDPFGRTDTF